MIWVSWRQQRPSLLVILVLVAAVAAVMTWFRFDALSYLRAHGIEGCTGINTANCSPNAMRAFSEEFRGYVSNLPLVLLALPALLGMFTGAPLFAREIEEGTHVFALTQSTGRTRWWATKLLVGGIPVAGLMAALGLVATWALAPLAYVAHGRMMTPGFETQGLVPTAYLVFAFAVGATAGLLVRNTLAAMAVTLVLHVAVLSVVTNVARPNYLDPEQISGTVEESAQASAMGAWVPDTAWRAGSSYTDASGNPVKFDPDACQSRESLEDCLHKQGVVRQRAAFHPDTQFWRFQLIESGLYLVLAAGVFAVGAAFARTRLGAR